MKKKYLKLNFVVFILLTLPLLSCESLIEIDSPNNKIDRSDVYQDIATAKSALSYLYTRTRDNSLIGKSVSGLSFSLSLYTDELDFYGTTPNNFYFNNIQANNDTMGKWWDQTYKDIYSINAFIEGVTASDKLSQEDKKHLLAEALVLRALFYQLLVQLYGDIPYTTTTDYVYNTTIGKTKPKRVLLEIEKDLLSAVENLEYTYRSTQRIYINKAVAELLLTENYLLQKRFDKAEFYSQRILNNNLYTIESDLNKVFKNTAKSTLWQISPALTTNITPEAGYYIFDKLSANSSVVSQHLLNSFDSNDLRLKNWTKPYTQNKKDMLQVYKYKNNKTNSDEFSIFFRLEQAYLMNSESLIHQGKISEAVIVLNELRSTRGLKNISVSITKEQAIEELLQEYTKEFFSEAGIRFFSLKRHQNLDKLIDIKSNWKSYHNLFPIHYRQLQINKNLLPNNTGY